MTTILTRPPSAQRLCLYPGKTAANLVEKLNDARRNAGNGASRRAGVMGGC